MSEQFRLLYDIKDFPSREDANNHFEEHWRSDNPTVPVGESTPVRNAFEGAHHRSGRWHLIKKLEIINYTRLSAEKPTPGAENARAQCPQCGQTGFHYRQAIPSVAIYVHIASIQDGRRVELARHVVEITSGGLIDYSDFRISS
jgi:hypothetical protein